MKIPKRHRYNERHDSFQYGVKILVCLFYSTSCHYVAGFSSTSLYLPPTKNVHSLSSLQARPSIRVGSYRYEWDGETIKNQNNNKKKKSPSPTVPPPPPPDNPRPIPAMPSDLFQQLALSQLELLANSLTITTTTTTNTKKAKNGGAAATASETKGKIESMALYLPQENVNTGQLEFLPAVIYPHPSTERVFIASDADSGVAPTLPKLLTKLPGFAAPDSLLPRYPMVSSSSTSTSSSSTKTTTTRPEPEDSAGVGVVEEVLCDVQSGAAALSVPLFLGSQTVGVLLVSPAVRGKSKKRKRSVWTVEDREQIARAARTLSMALSMDSERNDLKRQNQQVQSALSDSLHQVKNPLQALRTFGKLLQQRVAEQNDQVVADVGTTLQLLDLTQNLMVQSDRVVSLLAPMDSLVDSLESSSSSSERTPLYLNPAPERLDARQSLPVPWDQANPPNLPWETDTLEFARHETNLPKKTIKDSSADDTKNDATIEFSSRNRRQAPRPAKTRARKVSENSDSKGKEVMKAPPSESKRKASAAIVGEEDDLEMGFLPDVLESTFSMYRVLADEQGIAFKMLGLELSDELPGVFLRRKALQEAVSNVLDNAFKYSALANDESEKNKQPMVRVRVLPNEDKDGMPPGVTLIVEDNGPGICPDEAEAVFERGFRSSTVRDRAPGSGIGLDISRSLLGQMGGQLVCMDGATSSSFSPPLLHGAAFRMILFRRKPQ